MKNPGIFTTLAQIFTYTGIFMLVILTPAVSVAAPKVLIPFMVTELVVGLMGMACLGIYAVRQME